MITAISINDDAELMFPPQKSNTTRIMIGGDSDGVESASDRRPIVQPIIVNGTQRASINISPSKIEDYRHAFATFSAPPSTIEITRRDSDPSATATKKSKAPAKSYDVKYCEELAGGAASKSELNYERGIVQRLRQRFTQMATETAQEVQISPHIRRKRFPSVDDISPAATSPVQLDTNQMSNSICTTTLDITGNTTLSRQPRCVKPEIRTRCANFLNNNNTAYDESRKNGVNSNTFRRNIVVVNPAFAPKSRSNLTNGVEKDFIFNQYSTSSLCRRATEEQKKSPRKATVSNNDALADAFRRGDTQKLMINFSAQIRAEIESDVKRQVNENLAINNRRNNVVESFPASKPPVLENVETRNTNIERGGRKQAFSLLREKFERYSRVDSKENSAITRNRTNFGRSRSAHTETFHSVFIQQATTTKEPENEFLTIKLRKVDQPLETNLKQSIASSPPADPEPHGFESDGRVKETNMSIKACLAYVVPEAIGAENVNENDDSDDAGAKILRRRKNDDSPPPDEPMPTTSAINGFASATLALMNKAAASPLSDHKSPYAFATTTTTASTHFRSPSKISENLQKTEDASTNNNKLSFSTTLKRAAANIVEKRLERGGPPKEGENGIREIQNLLSRFNQNRLAKNSARNSSSLSPSAYRKSKEALAETNVVPDYRALLKRNVKPSSSAFADSIERKKSEINFHNLEVENAFGSENAEMGSNASLPCRPKVKEEQRKEQQADGRVTGDLNANYIKADETREKDTSGNEKNSDNNAAVIITKSSCVESPDDDAKTTTPLVKLRLSEELPCCKLSELILRRNEDNGIAKCEVSLKNKETESSALECVLSNGASRLSGDIAPKILMLQDDAAKLLHRTSDIECIFDYGSSHHYSILYNSVVERSSPKLSSSTLVEGEVEKNPDEKNVSNEDSTEEKKEEKKLVDGSTIANFERNSHASPSLPNEETMTIDCSLTENCVELAEVPCINETFEQGRKPEVEVQLDSSNGMDFSNNSSNSSSTSDAPTDGSTTSNISGSSNGSGFHQNDDDDSRLWLAADDELIFGDRKAVLDHSLMAEEDEDDENNLDDRVWRSRFSHHHNLQSPRMSMFSNDGFAVRHSLLNLALEEDIPALLEAMAEEHNFVFEDYSMSGSAAASACGIIHLPGEKQISDRRKMMRTAKTKITFADAPPQVFAYLDEESAASECLEDGDGGSGDSGWSCARPITFDEYQQMLQRAQDEINHQQLELDRWRQQIQDTRSQQQQNTTSGANNNNYCDSSASSISRHFNNLAVSSSTVPSGGENGGKNGAEQLLSATAQSLFETGKAALTA